METCAPLGTIGCAVRARRGRGTPGAVAATFTHGLLVRLSDDGFLMIGDGTISPHPHAITWNGRLPRPPRGAGVLLEHHRISIAGEPELPLDGLEEYVPLSAARAAAARVRIREALAAAVREIRSLPPRAGFHFLLAPDQVEPDLPPLALHLALEQSVRVKAALRARCIEALEDACELLAGLGPGLTPSGDDYVAGLLAALRFQGATFGCPFATDTLDRIAAAVERRTSEYSGFLVRCAAQGHLSAAVSRWLDAVLSAHLGEVAAATREVAKVGHSSGIDALAGMVHALEAMTEESRWTW